MTAPCHSDSWLADPLCWIELGWQISECHLKCPDFLSQCWRVVLYWYLKFRTFSYTTILFGEKISLHSIVKHSKFIVCYVKWRDDLATFLKRCFEKNHFPFYRSIHTPIKCTNQYLRSSSVLREVCIPGQTQSCYCFDFVALETSVHTAVAVKILNKSFCNYTLRQLGWLLSFSMFKKIIADPCKGTCTNSELNTICVRSKTLTCFVSWYWSFSSWDSLLRNSWDSCWDSSELFIFGALNTGSGFSCSAAGALRPVIDQTFSMYLILLFRTLQTGMDRELFQKRYWGEEKMGGEKVVEVNILEKIACWFIFWRCIHTNFKQK